MELISAQLWSKRLALSVLNTSAFEALLPEVEQLPPVQGPKTLHEMVVDIIEEHEGHYDEGLDINGAARALIEFFKG